MNNVLFFLILLLSFVAIIGIFNEKLIKIPNDIALVLFSFIIMAIAKIFLSFGIFNEDWSFFNTLLNFHFEEFLLDGILCFMLFAGASKVHLTKFIQNGKPILLLSLLSTLITSFIYGGLFYLISSLLSLNIDIWICILLGSIVSPTDPIAATSILNKCGLSKSVTSVIEGESLFNDGIGVAIFICIKNIITKTSDLPFPLLMAKELLGAIAVGLIVSFILFKILKLSKMPMMHIIISILTVAISYVTCEKLGFSGVIASVVCGMYFSYKMSKNDKWRIVVDPNNTYETFWDSTDYLMNSILFVLIGMTVLFVSNISYIIIIIISGVVINVLSRFLGVYFSSFVIGKKVPNRYSKLEFASLLTWSGLKGGLSLALAFQVKDVLPSSTYNLILIVTFSTIFFTIVFQGLSIAFFYHKVEAMKEKRIIKIDHL